MKIFFFALIFAFCQTVSAQTDSTKGFAIYLLPANVKSNQLNNLNLKKLKPFGQPVITESDIRYYQKDNHEFGVDNLAAARIKKINSRGGTKPFVVFAGHEAVYVGAFWKSILSSTFDGIVIDTYKAVGGEPYGWWTDFPILFLELGYPSPNYFKGTDSRSDERVLKALESAGKLYDLAELVVKCKKIKPTRKRRLSHIFTFDVIGVAKGEFKEKEIEFELSDYKLLPELEYNEGIYAGKAVNFNSDQELVLTISRQVGKEKPDYFLRAYRKK